MTNANVIRYEIRIPAGMREKLRTHLLTDRSREQLAILLCGTSRSGQKTRLLGRHLLLMPKGTFTYQSSGGLALTSGAQSTVLGIAAREGLSQVDFHTHPGEGSHVAFSGIDDTNERALAAYLARKMPGTLYASVVLKARASAARIWTLEHGEPVVTTISPPDLEGCHIATPSRHGDVGDNRFDRQVRAFGHEFQCRLQQIKVGLVGVGGLGSIVVEELSRLGVRDWVLVDPDKVEVSNLNRLLGATPRDADEEVAKVTIAARTIRRSEPRARVKSIRASVFAPRALRALTECDLVIAATDNDMSRLVLNALCAQYLIQLAHLGVNLAPKTDGGFDDISGEVAIPALGEWCLLCSGIVSSVRAGWDIARPEERELLTARGYLEGTPAPAVYHLNALVASLAVTEIHNLVWPYKPLRRYLVYRELESELLSVQVPAQEHCLHCGSDGRLGLGDLVPLWRPTPAQSLSIMDLPSAEPLDSETHKEG